MHYARPAIIILYGYFFESGRIEVSYVSRFLAGVSGELHVDEAGLARCDSLGKGLG